jgi:hypothetical protein
MIRIPWVHPRAGFTRDMFVLKSRDSAAAPSRREQRLPRRRAYLSAPLSLPRPGLLLLFLASSRIFMRAGWQERREDTRAGVMARISAPDLEQRFSAKQDGRGTSRREGREGVRDLWAMLERSRVTRAIPRNRFHRAKTSDAPPMMSRIRGIAPESRRR